jgi:hypothetical protein
MLEAIGTKMALHFAQIDPCLPGRGRDAALHMALDRATRRLAGGGHNLNHDRHGRVAYRPVSRPRRGVDGSEAGDRQ